MKRLAPFAILAGLASLVGIVVISAKSEAISDFAQTYGFVLLGYFGIISFSWGWLKIFSKK
ncbi:MAG TPA: hypothetical protein GX692_05545 [Acholeplasmataceae bacterium]|jgi:hypothetical protein|nr:hypothetical protein [Acholeplasmataceae bacterium]